MSSHDTSTEVLQPKGDSGALRAIPAAALKVLEPCEGGSWAVTGQSGDSFLLSYMTSNGSEIASYTMTPCTTEEQIRKLCKKHLYDIPQSQPPVYPSDLSSRVQATVPLPGDSPLPHPPLYSPQPEHFIASSYHDKSAPNMYCSSLSPEKANPRQDESSEMTIIDQGGVQGTLSDGFEWNFGDGFFPPADHQLNHSGLGHFADETETFFSGLEDSFNPILTNDAWNQFGNKEALESMFTTS